MLYLQKSDSNYMEDKNSEIIDEDIPEKVCPLTESQLNIYLDIIAHDKLDAYLLPLNISVPNEYGVDDLLGALNSMFEIHPILKMRISDEFEVPCLVEGRNPTVSVESYVDEEIGREFVTKPFDLKDSLARFLILKNDDVYELFAVFHHLIFDGLSRSVFEQNLLEILKGNSLEVEESFLEVAAFNEEMEEMDEFDDAGSFYEVMLADSDDAGALLPSVSADGYGKYGIDLEADITDFVEKYGISKNVLFTGVFAYTLSRFVGDDKVVFNTLENGRDRFDCFNSIGMFVNTLPLLVDCKNQDVDSYIKQISDLIRGIRKYNYYPYRILANEYEINSDIIFQYIPDWFVADDLTYTRNNFKNLISEGIIGDRNDLINDFSADVTKNGDKYSLNIMYSDKFSVDMVKHFCESFKLVLHDIIKVDKLSEINYITSSDIELLDSYNQNEYPLDYEDIMDAFNDNLAQNPDNKLVSYNDKSYTYGEGAFIADKIAERLKENGVEKQDNVAFLVERSELYVLSILGIISMGAVYVPLDDAHPDDRIEFILKDTESKVVIASDETYERAEDLTDDAIILNISDIINEDIKTLSRLPVVPGRLSCILYTSGTTGVPKGVKITRKSLVNYIGYYVRKSGISNEDVFALYASIGFDVGAIKSIFVPIYSGACLDIIPKDIRLDMSKLNEHFQNHNVTHAHLPTQVAKLFINNVDNHSLDVLCTGGEKLGEVDYSCDYLFVDSYGPTEACVSVTAIKEADKIDSSSIGYLLDNLKAYVLDDEFRRVPIGAVGELYLSGIQLADGYLHRDEETKKAFLANPFDDDEEFSVMYRSGDMVRILPDGSFGVMGRRDKQVKIRGNRVELSEIEAVIREIDYVEDLTVQTIKHGTNNELVAYVVTSNDMDENVLGDSIREYVSKNKPDYMIPSYIVKLDEIPLNVNGKVNKRELPEINFGNLHVDYVAATNESEKFIIDAFENVFDMENIGLFDDFVRLGGDSISAIRVITLLQKNGVSCTARDILNFKTPYLIAQNLKEFKEEISYDPVEGEIDLLPIQKYFFDQNNKNEFSQQFILKSKVNLNVDNLQKSLDELCNIHDMLRVVYKFDDDGNPIQEVLPLDTRVCEVKEFTISDLTEFNGIFINSLRSLNIHDKLLDVSLIHYKDQDYVLFIIHHMIIDGVSWNILLVDLTYIYYRLVKGKKIDLLRPYPYKNWIEDVKELAYNISEEEKEHWIEVDALLNDSKIKGKTNIYAFNVEIDYKADNLLMLSEEEYWALAIARAYKKTYDEDIIFNRESHGRDDTISNLNRTIGWFTSQYPVPIDISGNDDDISLVRDVYTLKTAFKDIDNLGLNYSSLIYTTGDLEYKHCPVTFNFLSNEFVFENVLFKSINDYLDSNEQISIDVYDDEFYGISLNVTHSEDLYLVAGAYALDTYIGDKYDEFVKNIRNELKFIANYNFEENIACCLSEPQMGIYLDEKVNDKGIAYSTSGIFECDLDKSAEEIKNAIYALIDKHPVLKGRVLDDVDMPLLVCDSYPSVEVVDNDDTDTFVKPFDLGENLARFFIIDMPERKSIFFDIHHIISDATSLSIIVRDLTDALKGNLDGTVDLGFVYSSYDFYNSKFQSHYNAAHEFFARNFTEIEDVPGLLSDVDGSEGSVILPIRGFKDKIEEFTHDNGITVGNLLYAVFAYTYSRFTGANKAYFNIMEHGRHDKYVQDAVGIFVRTIPLVVDCSKCSVKEFVSNVSDLVLDSMTNSIYPFRLLASEFNLNNNIFFEYNADLNDTSFIGNEMICTDYAIDTVGEFSCIANDLEDGYSIMINHSDEYSQETAKRFAYAFKEILTQILDKDDLKEIEYVSCDDLKLLDEYNETEYQLDYDDILDAFNDNLSKYPDNKLVSFNDVSYTYAEGAFIADKIAEKLADLGIKAQDNVAFLTERCQNYMFAVLGILSAGAVYVPLDDKHPDERIKFILEDTASKVVIASDETYERAEKLSEAVVLNISEIFEDNIGSLDALPVSYGNLACILYTSGTTGLPKGVKVTRKSLLNVCESYINDYNLDNSDVYALFSGIGFDVSSFVISVVMHAGACLSVVPEEIRLNMYELNKYFIAQNVSHAFITTQVGKLFMQNVDETSLDVLLVAGEKLGEFESPENYQLVDAYGPTEAFAFVTSIPNSDKLDYSSVGFCNCNVKAYVLDDEFRRVPIGASGELYLAGYQVADGYLNREEETVNAFLDNPFDDGEEFGVMYRTGDIVRVLPDGSLGIAGRRDSQVKIRGNRVELSEIEAVIREVDEVKDVTVQTVKQGTNTELIAYVVGIEKEDALNDLICAHVGHCKPDYMIPSFVVKLDEIPLNVNGKVDKRALPEVNLSSLRAEYLAPTTKDEKLIVEAFEKVFDQKRISLNDDFIRLGGDSLTAIKLVSCLEGYNVTVADILSLRTPLAIAGSIREFDFDLDIYSVEEGCPLTESQLNIYLDIIANKKTDSYLIPMNIAIPDEYDVESLVDALEKMFIVHPILNMKVSDEFEVPYLVKGSKPSIHVESEVSQESGHEFLTAQFDLDESLCRFLILKNDDMYNLFAVFHHLIFDGLSASVFEHDLFNVLNHKFVDLDDSFLKVSALNTQMSEIDEFDNAALFYESMLADIDESGVLLDSVCPDGPGIYNMDLGIDIDEFLNSHEISENVLFTSVFAYTLSRFMGDDKVFFNIVENGRDRLNNFNSIGMFVNTLPLLVECKDQKISSFIEYMSDMVYGVIGYNFYPFRLLANEYDVNSDILFQFKPEWFIKENVTFGENTFNRDVNDEIIEDMSDFIADLEVDVIQKGNDYSLNIIYSDKYSKELIEHIGESYKLILQDFISVEKLSEINYTSSADLKLLDSYNETEYDFKYSDILDAFNDNLPKYENETLVGYKDKSYTHGQSAFIANEIAGELTDIGIHHKDFVSLFVPRSELFLLTSLGVLSMGGAYVPIETTYPDERIILMLTDSSSKAVIVSDESEEKISRIINDNNLDIDILNISHIFKGYIGSLSHLDTVDVMEDDVACVLYTSGTTGTPKGSLTPRRALNNFVSWYVTETNFTCEDVYGMHCSYVFDMHTHALYSPVITGGALYIVPEEIRLDLGALNNYFVEHKCTHTFITSQVGKLFAESGMDTSIKLLCFGGMKLGELNAPDSIGPFESYGPSENLAISTSIFANRRIHTSSIGRFISNVKGYVLDSQHRRVPVGAVGELYLAGKQLSLGYLNREEVNAKAFFENTFDDLEGYERIYATGDIVRFLPDGTLGIVGRQDSQVKVRGNRVELPEVESVIRKISFIEDVTVQTVVNNGNNELVAYVVVSDEADEDNLRNDIREYVADRKPDYMVPSFVVRLDELPLNVNGKIDKRALPDVDLSNLGGEYVAPENEIEAFFVKCFEELLGVSKVSTTDDFFEMGGDSMLVIKIIYKSLNEGYTITYADLFDNPTPKSLSRVILKTQQKSDNDVEEYDYAPIDNLLHENNITSFNQGKCDDGLGDVLLTGVTGFLGIHILSELLEHEKGNVYCLIRSKKDSTIEERFAELSNYYFGHDLSEYNDRLHLVEGDITNPDDFKKLESDNIDTVINSAANVKHFAHGSEIKDINLDGAVNTLEFAKSKDAKFVQISTVSVAGIRVENMPEDFNLHENELYIGQDYISNKYVESKFLAERAILESAINDNTDVKIMRVGNLMARSYDSKFQINYETNAFMNSLESFVTLGKISRSISVEELEFSPIDLTAKAIVMLAKTPKECVVFHPATNKYVTYAQLANVFNKLDLNLEIVDDEVFNQSLKDILKDESKQKGMFGLTTILNDDNELVNDYLPADKEYTLEVLSELGFEWPETSEKYLFEFIKILKEMEFFKI
ncbi:amino acid adenylation domain-containing protein [Methanobrevibacter sp.]